MHIRSAWICDYIDTTACAGGCIGADDIFDLFSAKAFFAVEIRQLERRHGYGEGIPIAAMSNVVQRSVWHGARI
jgi:hypothetical protein